jgi:hypothetical protein
LSEGDRQLQVSACGSRFLVPGFRVRRSLSAHRPNQEPK